MSIIMAIIVNINMIIIITTTTSSSSSSSFQNCTESLPRRHDTATTRGSRSENQRRTGFVLDIDPDFWLWQSLHWFWIKIKTIIEHLEFSTKTIKIISQSCAGREEEDICGQSSGATNWLWPSCQILKHWSIMILMIMLLNDTSKVSKLGLAVNSLVFGGFQPVDVLADIRSDLVHRNSQSLWLDKYRVSEKMYL